MAGGAIRARWGFYCGLAEDAARVLDRPLSLMLDRAWVGGGAPVFERELAARREGLQAAWVQVLEGLAEANRFSETPLFAGVGALESASSGSTGSRLPPLSVPSVRSSVGSAACYVEGAFTGVDLEGFTDLARRLVNAQAELLGAVDQVPVWSLMGGLGGSQVAPALDRVREIAGWAGAQGRDVQRRLELVHAAEGAAVGLTHAPGVGGPLVPAGVAANWVFGASVGDPLDAVVLVDRLVSGDADSAAAAVAKLVQVQQAEFDPGLAGKVNAAWAAMAPSRRAELMAAAGPALGALDGIPSRVRDQVNQIILLVEKDKLGRQKAALEAVIGAADPRVAVGLQAQLDDVKKRFETLTAISNQLALTRDPPVPRLLLGFDVVGNGHAIVAIGDPDTATDTVTYVPGLGTTLDSTAGGMRRARNLYDSAATFAGPDQVISSIYWLGYDAPQPDLSILNPTRSVASDDSAERGSVGLAGFASGLTATSKIVDRHTVLLGHSYGSLTTGKAAVLASGTLADDIIFVGSPGVGVDHADDLGVGAGHVFAGAAKNDPVTILPDSKQLKIGLVLQPGMLLPMAVTDMVTNYTGLTDITAFGTSPAREDFGARRFEVADGKPLSFESHSDYWVRYSRSLASMGAVVAGRPDQIKPPRDEG